MQIQLERLWTLGEKIGGGGFGEVFEASAVDCGRAVAKLVPKTDGAQRELLFVDLGGARNVIPILDSGETTSHYMLIMPCADKSLRRHLADTDRPLDPAEAISVLVDVTTALSDLDGKVVHRDLKPENILLHEGKWCLADFGISRYAEASTAPDTQKYALSPRYAAPERWRNERATTAADVYSLGVIAHELLSKSLPFSGTNLSDLREQHLHEEPASLDGVPSNLTALVALVQECLCKAAAARPRPAAILQRLQRISEPPRTGGLAKLQEAHQNEVKRRTEHARFESRLRSEQERRSELFDAAKTQLDQILESLRAAIVAVAPSVRDLSDIAGMSMGLGNVEMQSSPVARTNMEPWEEYDQPAFTVVGHSSIGIRIPPDRHQYKGRSHSLWFCDAVEEDNFQWFETAFMISPLIPERGSQNPFALGPGKEAAQALSNTIGRFQVAWPPTRLIVGELDEFIDRWSSWLADAANGTLRNPSSMPERPITDSWRRR